MDLATKQRAQLLGELVETARKHARRSADECAAVLGISSEAYGQVESGEHPLSLPDLEALAIFLDVPMGFFWGTESLQTDEAVNYNEWITLRNRVIGVLLNQMRLKSKKTHEELAEHVGVEPATIQAYETGETAVPYVYLEALCRFMGASPTEFLDDERGPMGRHEARHKLQRQFERMPPEMQQFLVNPVNLSYLDTAKRISEMDVQKLRQVAENLLDITY